MSKINVQTPLFEKVQTRSFKGSNPVICKGSTPYKIAQSRL